MRVVCPFGRCVYAKAQCLGKQSKSPKGIRNEREFAMNEEIQTVGKGVAFVTGAASGIGRATAEVLSAEGYRVVVADINVEQAAAVAASLPNDAFALECDVTSKESVNVAIKSVLNSAGRIDVLVNVAGVSRVKPFMETDEADWYLHVEVNLLGVYRMVHAVLPTMVAQGYGRIVSIASERGRQGGASEAAYSGAKGGVIAFSKAIAREVGGSGITANCVAPGPINTPPLQKLIEEGGREHIDRALAELPIPRLGEPEEVAAAVRYLASREAGYVTGQTIGVGGGIAMP
jgi:2-hydroxycyclohexanecarboxyl-CoA dehydrogenase